MIYADEHGKQIQFGMSYTKCVHLFFGFTYNTHETRNSTKTKQLKSE